VLQVEHGSLYPALRRLERDGCITSNWEATDGGREMRLYRLTATGRKQLDARESRWRAVVQAMARMLETGVSMEDPDDDLAREIRAHLELEADEQQAAGLSPHEARAAALRAFGNVTRVREDARAVWTLVWWEQLRQDVRYALRTLGRSPGFAATAVIVLALGIGSVTAIFQLWEAVVLRTLPVPDAGRLVVLDLADRSTWRGRRTTGARSSAEGSSPASACRLTSAVS
jgi:DNA-binding PadR family transcriptional regulator